MKEPIEPDLTHMPEPMPPATLARNVMARVSRLADERRPAPGSSPAARETARGAHRRGWQDVPAFVAALAGLSTVFAAWIDGRFETGWWWTFVSSYIRATDLARPPLNGLALVGLAAGLVIYAAGLFAPLRGERSHHGRA